MPWPTSARAPGPIADGAAGDSKTGSEAAFTLPGAAAAAWPRTWRAVPRSTVAVPPAGHFGAFTWCPASLRAPGGGVGSLAPGPSAGCPGTFGCSGSGSAAQTSSLYW
nr:hypothetical protein [Streptomyces sp. S1D4-11]QIY98782.1 hypothetical protein HEP87_38480 [Streptomyces sp. S1D4-11]